MTRTQYATTNGGFKTNLLPWRLYQKGKQLAWDPAEIDFTQDAKDWQTRDEGARKLIARLATTFMVGEEAVTLDIVPLLRAISDEGRIEETLFLTTFLSDEAKHAEFFRTWFDAIGWDADLDSLLTPAQKFVFDEELPRAMGRLETDRSPEAFLDASITYNHFVEGVLALTGYWAWDRVFTMQEGFPGIRAGLEMVQRDERRHLAYGTYLCRRIVAAHPETWPFVEQRIAELREMGLRFVDDLGAAIFEDFKRQAGPSGDTEEFNELAKAIMAEFTDYGQQLLDRRLAAIATARGTSEADVETSDFSVELEEDALV
ncbi:MAG: R2-like ligand-binding oxidase [Actinomycetota bacterium]